MMIRNPKTSLKRVSIYIFVDMGKVSPCKSLNLNLHILGGLYGM